jgi:hypothetical protein
MADIKTPTRIATHVVAEDAINWTVECEGDGCTNAMLVAKATTDWNNNRTEFTAPAARRCAACGPFTTVAR